MRYLLLFIPMLCHATMTDEWRLKFLTPPPDPAMMRVTRFQTAAIAAKPAALVAPAVPVPSVSVSWFQSGQVLNYGLDASDSPVGPWRTIFDAQPGLWAMPGLVTVQVPRTNNQLFFRPWANNQSRKL